MVINYFIRFVQDGTFLNQKHKLFSLQVHYMLPAYSETMQLCVMTEHFRHYMK